MKIQFLWFAGCPSHDIALDRLASALDQEGVTPEIEIVEIKTEQQAEKYRFIGSPTIRIDGADIDPPGQEALYRLTCRTYITKDGRFSPVPSDQLIRDGIRRHSTVTERKELQS
jgi:hypothetical protein